MNAEAGASGARSGPRIGPGDAGDIGLLNHALARLAGVPIGGVRPSIMTTLARHRRLFRPWLRFAAALMPRGLLPRRDTELVILRVAHNAGCEYEWRHHEHLAAAAGLASEEIERVRRGPDADGWSRRRQLLLRAVDELHAERTISEPLWGELRPLLSDAELIELCMLVGHYEMLAMTLRALGVEPDPPPATRPRLERALRLALSRRRRPGTAA